MTVMNERPSVTPSPTRPRVVMLCAAVAGLIGLVVALIYGAGSLSEDPGTALFVAATGLLSLIAAYGYWLEKRWSLYAHTLSVLAQVLFPGSLFGLSPDAYHLFAFFAPLLSIAVLARMALYFKKKRLKETAPIERNEIEGHKDG